MLIEMEMWPPLIAAPSKKFIGVLLVLATLLAPVEVVIGSFNINDGRNANKNYLLSSDSQNDGLCGVRNRANQP